MLFNSYIFIFAFFPLVLFGYFGLNHLKQYKAALGFLVVMSLWFYGYQNLYYMLLLICGMLLNYAVVLFLSGTAVPAYRKTALAVGLVINLGNLFLFKYFNFFISNVNTISGRSFSLLNLVLPLGISFYTFQQLSYLIDSYRQECEKYSFLEYAAYITYFPHISAGPIVSHSELIARFRNPLTKKMNYENLSKGLYAFALGLGKKVLLADSLAKLVNIGYGEIGQLNTPSAMLVMLCYSLQIYFDFSGYCDMANGLSCMLNIELPVNFNSPYKAESVSDFWDRWHITLTRFFTKYIYIPLGGSRRGMTRTCINIMIVFLVSGLWHGANWTFILWGAINGAALVLERLVKYPKWKLPKWIKIPLAFIFSTFAWSLFRAPSLTDAGLLWKQLFCGGLGRIYEPLTTRFQEFVEISVLYRLGLGNFLDSYPWFCPVAFVLLLVAACFLMRNTKEKAENMKMTVRKLIVTAGLLFWSILSLSEISEFLYFNF